MSRLHAHLAAASLAIAVLLLTASAPALAHTELQGSEPGPGQVLDEPPTAVSLTFNESLVNRAVTASVKTPGTDDFRRVTTRTRGNVVSAAIRADSVPRDDRGTWVLAYRVSSSDGHPVVGEVSFEVEGSSAPTSASPSVEGAPSTVETSGSDRDPDSSGSSPTGLIAVVGLGGLVLAGTALMLGRGRAGHDAA